MHIPPPFKSFDDKVARGRGWGNNVWFMQVSRFLTMKPFGGRHIYMAHLEGFPPPCHSWEFAMLPESSKTSAAVTMQAGLRVSVSMALGPLDRLDSADFRLNVECLWSLQEKRKGTPLH